MFFFMKQYYFHKKIHALFALFQRHRILKLKTKISNLIKPIYIILDVFLGVDHENEVKI